MLSAQSIEEELELHTETNDLYKVLPSDDDDEQDSDFVADEHLNDEEEEEDDVDEEDQIDNDEVNTLVQEVRSLRTKQQSYRDTITMQNFNSDDEDVEYEDEQHDDEDSDSDDEEVQDDENLGEEVKDGIINAELGTELFLGNKVLKNGKEIESEIKDLSLQINKLMNDDETMVL
jgi:hypothetical protein